MIAYRKSWFAEVGYNEFPDTWEQYREAGKKLKAKGRPIGQTLGHSFGDAPTFAYPLLWSCGGKEVEADGKTVVINSKETIESVKFMVAFWKDAYDEGGLAWDDANNNRAFLSQHHLLDAQRRLDLHRVAAQARPVHDREGQAAQGPTSCTRRCRRVRQGQFGFHTYQSHVMPSYSKNQKAAKDFLRWIHTKAELRASGSLSQKGFATPGTTELGDSTRCGTRTR